MQQKGESEQEPQYGEVGEHSRPDLAEQATCGVCGQVLDHDRDDLYVEMCSGCETTGLKVRQTRTHVRKPHPRRF